MKKVYQTKFGKEGNCFPACLASILEIGIDEIPNFQEPQGEWYTLYKKWLNRYSLDLIALLNWDDQPKNCPEVYSIVSGKSPRGLQHATVYYGLEMVHDPHPDGGGVKGITEWIYIVSKHPVKNRGVIKYQLNEKGQCPVCKIKPLIYKRKGKYFCHRCDRAYDLVTKKQIQNFFYDCNGLNIRGIG